MWIKLPNLRTVRELRAILLSGCLPAGRQACPPKLSSPAMKFCKTKFLTEFYFSRYSGTVPLKGLPPGYYGYYRPRALSGAGLAN